jgi:hypothetical protein
MRPVRFWNDGDKNRPRVIAGPAASAPLRTSSRPSQSKCCRVPPEAQPRRNPDERAGESGEAAAVAHALDDPSAAAQLLAGLEAAACDARDDPF